MLWCAILFNLDWQFRRVLVGLKLFPWPAFKLRVPHASEVVDHSIIEHKRISYKQKNESAEDTAYSSLKPDANFGVTIKANILSGLYFQRWETTGRNGEFNLHKKWLVHASCNRKPPFCYPIHFIRQKLVQHSTWSVQRSGWQSTSTSTFMASCNDMRSTVLPSTTWSAVKQFLRKGLPTYGVLSSYILRSGTYQIPTGDNFLHN